MCYVGLNIYWLGRGHYCKCLGLFWYCCFQEIYVAVRHKMLIRYKTWSSCLCGYFILRSFVWSKIWLNSTLEEEFGLRYIAHRDFSGKNVCKVLLPNLGGFKNAFHEDFNVVLRNILRTVISIATFVKLSSSNPKCFLMLQT